VFTLWTITVYLVRNKKCFWITLIPALFMTTVCTTFFFLSKQMLGLPEAVAYPMGIACLIAACVWFAVWYRKESQK
jgi:carbon starvation protein CstA